MQFIFFCIYSYKLFYLLFINYDYIDLQDQLFMNISKEKLLNMNHHPSMMLNLHLFVFNVETSSFILNVETPSSKIHPRKIQRINSRENGFASLEID